MHKLSGRLGHQPLGALLIKRNFEQGIAAHRLYRHGQSIAEGLMNTRSPAAKFGSGLLLAAEASDALGAAFAAETYRARATCGRESVGSGASRVREPAALGDIALKQLFRHLINKARRMRILRAAIQRQRSAQVRYSCSFARVTAT